MKLAFCLYKYFPFGGMQRDFLRIARECAARGHEVRAYVLEWEGDAPAELEVIRVAARGLSNIARYRDYSARVRDALERDPVDRVVGFNKMPGLDYYYAADPCFAEKARSRRPWWYRLGARYRHFRRYEQRVFAPGGHTHVMVITERQKREFRHHYGTEEHRFSLLPPGIDEDRRAPADRQARRAAFRQARGHGDEDILLLHVGSDFSRKGLDRAIRTLASLHGSDNANAWLYVLGEDREAPYQRLAEQLGVAEHVCFLGGRDDVPSFLLGADLLLHPAYDETGGIVLVEALVAGLPVVATDTCGFAFHVERAGGGTVIPSPFRQQALDESVRQAVQDAALRQHWQDNCLAYARDPELYRSSQKAADIILGAAR